MTTLIIKILPIIIGILSIPNPNLDGRWQVVKAELAGNAFPEEVTKSLLLVISGETYELQNDRGTLRFIDGDKMEITGTGGPNNGRTIKAIYDRQGDELTICYDLSGKDFPTSYDSKANPQSFLVSYTLVK